jgi:hypothetical protein
MKFIPRKCQATTAEQRQLNYIEPASKTRAHKVRKRPSVNCIELSILLMGCGESKI